MKFFDFDSEKAANTMAELIPLVEKIMTDESIKRFFEIADKGDARSTFDNLHLTFSGLGGVALAMLKDHRAEIFQVLALLNDVTVEDIKAQKMRTTVNQIKEVFTSEELKNLFTLRRQ